MNDTSSASSFIIQILYLNVVSLVFLMSEIYTSHLFFIFSNTTCHFPYEMDER